MTLAVEDTLLHVLELLQKGEWAAAFDKLAVAKRDIEGGRIDYMAFAKDTIERDYFDTVRGIVDEVTRQWRAGEFEGDRDRVLESIGQSCDNACTYTQTSQFYLAVSKYDDAYMEEFGEAPLQNDNINWEAMATMAIRREVLDRLNRNGDIDVNDDPPSKPTIECTECTEWKEGEGTVCNDCKEDASDDADDDDEDDELPSAGDA